MKLRWREQEIIFVSILAVSEIIASLWILYEPSAERTGVAVVLLQSGTVLFYYIGYLSINLLIIPSFQKISFTDIEKLFTLKIGIAVFLIAITGFLLAFGVNLISYYAKPHLVNYGGFQMLAWLGYNDKPLTNIFFGFDRAIGLVMLFTALAGLREFMIWVIMKPVASREFRVMVINNVIPLLFLYFLVLYWGPCIPS